jgi:hypothetical protein
VATVTILEVARFAAPGGRVVRQLLVTLLAVGTLVLGILIMHSVASPSEPANSSALESLTQEQREGVFAIAADPALAHEPTHGSIGCGGPCDDTHDAGLMLCILALLTAGIFLRYASVRLRIPPRGHGRLLPRQGRPPARLTPILEALSISRT